ncbi:MAG: histidine phosphatase family protein [Cellulomonas sp.]
MRLILVRHGQTPSNVRHLLDTGEPGASLTDLGRTQAAALPAALGGERIGIVFASSLARAQETAAPLAKALGLPVLVRAGVREVSAGTFEMRGDVASVERYLATVFAWPAGELGRRMPGGEDGREVLTRFDAVVAEAVAATELAAVVVSHGAVIRVWTSSRAHNLDAAFAATHDLVNAGTVILEGDLALGWRAVSWTGADLDGATGDRPTTIEPGF